MRTAHESVYRIDTCIDMRIDMRIDMHVDMCIDMCMDACIDPAPGASSATVTLRNPHYVLRTLLSANTPMRQH